MHFSGSITFDFSTPSFSAFTHVRNRKGHAVEARQTRFLIVPVDANLMLRFFHLRYTISLTKAKRPWDGGVMYLCCGELF